MATNILPHSIAELLDLGNLNISGIAACGSAIGLLQYTVANYTPKVADLQAKQDVFNGQRASVAELSATRILRIADMRKGCLLARTLLAITFGKDWSEQWVAAGWTDHTTEVPQNAGELETLSGAVAKFLIAKPEYQVASSKINFNASLYVVLKNDYNAADSAFRAGKVLLGNARDGRKVEEADLRKSMRGLGDILPDLIGPMDPRWDLFGFNRPGATVKPGKPEGLTLAKLAGQAAVLAQCSAVSLATYYRWFSKLIGVDTEFRFGGRTNDPLKEFPDQPTAGILEVFCEAANEAGPGVESATSSINLAL